jgi:hypothetical protein
MVQIAGRVIEAGPKSAWGKRRAVARRLSPEFREARFWISQFICRPFDVVT